MKKAIVSAANLAEEAKEDDELGFGGPEGQRLLAQAEEELEEQHIYPSTVRLSIGIENIDDLIEALDEAFTYVK